MSGSKAEEAVDRLTAELAHADGLLRQRNVEVERLREALARIVQVPLRWGAPIHGSTDAEKAWAAAGSEVHLIAHRALDGSLESARAALDGTEK